MSAHFGVDPEQLRAHASQVAGLAQDLGGNTGAHGGLLAGNALGSFVQSLTSGLQGAMTSTSDSIGHASQAMHDVHAGLLATADRYQGIDADNASLLTREDPR